MAALIWIGALFTLMGLAGLVIAIFRAVAIRRGRMDEAAARAALQKIVPLNLGSLMLSMLGLMLVIVGVMLA